MMTEEEQQALYIKEQDDFVRWCGTASGKKATDIGAGLELGEELRRLHATSDGQAALRVAFSHGWRSNKPIRDEQEEKVTALRKEVSELSSLLSTQTSHRIQAEHNAARLQARIDAIGPVRKWLPSDNIWRSCFAVSEIEWNGASDGEKEMMVQRWAANTKRELNIQMAQAGNVPGRA